jgi:hypothetical protein
LTASSPAYQVQPSSGPDTMAVHPLSAPAAGFLSPRAQSRLDDATLGDEPTLTVAEPPPARGHEGGEGQGVEGFLLASMLGIARP